MKYRERDQLRLLIAFALAFLLVSVMAFRQAKSARDSLNLQVVPVATPSAEIAVAVDEPVIELLELEALPPSKILPGVSQTFQTFNNCGPASLSMALSFYGISESQGVLGTALRPYQNAAGNNDDKSVTLAELAAKASEYDFIVYHRPAGDIDMIKHFINNDMPVVTRTWLVMTDDIGHYRVVTGYDDLAGQLVQNDSLQGANLRYSYSDFLDLWQAFNYEYMVLVPREKEAIALAILGESADEKFAWQRALEISERQLELDGQDVYAQFNKLVALCHLGDYRQAIQIFEQVENRLPSRMLWYQLEPLQAYYQTGQHDRVLALSSKILNNNNRAYSELYYLRGLIYSDRGQTEEANREFDLAKRYNGTDYWRANLELELEG